MIAMAKRKVEFRQVLDAKSLNVVFFQTEFRMDR